MIGNPPARVTDPSDRAAYNARMSKITVYGADWCGDSRRTRRQLDALGIPYKFVNVDDDEAASAWITEQNNGKPPLRSTVDIDGELLIEPSNTAQMDVYLRSIGMIK